MILSHYSLFILQVNYYDKVRSPQMRSTINNKEKTNLKKKEKRKEKNKENKKEKEKQETMWQCDSYQKSIIITVKGCIIIKNYKSNLHFIKLKVFQCLFTSSKI